jgi:peroxiredoxin
VKFEYCNNCKENRGFKRHVGWGTYFGGLFTLGISLLFIPFYPLRCIVCGNKLVSTKQNEEGYTNNSVNYKKGLILVIILAVAAAAIFIRPDEKSYKTIMAIGIPAPAFELRDSTGKLWKLSDLKGKVVFINFWATWCTTCKAETPYKVTLFNNMQGKPFQMLGVLYRDSPENLPAYFRQHNITSPTLIDPDNAMAKLYGITGVPETFILDKEGILRERVIGPREWTSPDNLALIEKWL